MRNTVASPTPKKGNKNLGRLLLLYYYFRRIWIVYFWGVTITVQQIRLTMRNSYQTLQNRENDEIWFSHIEQHTLIKTATSVGKCWALQWSAELAGMVIIPCLAGTPDLSSQPEIVPRQRLVEGRLARLLLRAENCAQSLENKEYGRTIQDSGREFRGHSIAFWCFWSRVKRFCAQPQSFTAMVFDNDSWKRKE